LALGGVLGGVWLCDGPPLGSLLDPADEVGPLLESVAVVGLLAEVSDGFDASVEECSLVLADDSLLCVVCDVVCR